jgi:hypothetical protein
MMAAAWCCKTDRGATRMTGCKLLWLDAKPGRSSCAILKTHRAFAGNAFNSSYRTRTGVPRRTATGLMHHGDRRLTDVTYTDASPLGTAEAIAGLPTLLDPPSKIESQISGAAGQSASSPVTTGKGVKVNKTTDTIGQSHVLAQGDTKRRKGANGARCRVRTCDFFGVNEALYH